ncbi:MAG: DoxX family membrane protein [Phycisphaerales bacterium]
MAEGNRAALGCAPVVLRVMLAVTFLWAGAGKVFKDGEFAGAEAAALANMGLSLRPTREVVAPVSRPPTAPTGAQPGTATPPAPASNPAVTPERPIPLPGGMPKKDPGKPSKSPPREPGPMVGQADGSGLPVVAAMQTGTTTATTLTGGTYKPEDFPRAVAAPRLYSLAVLLHNAALPRAGEGGKTFSPYWPSYLGAGATPLYLAWAAALTELLAGALLLVGLFTRLGAFLVCMVMLNAMWLTQFGPAIQSGNTMLGVLPAYDWWDPKPWTPLMWQLALLASGLALMLLGAGALSVDSNSEKAPPSPKAEKHPRPI